MDFIPTIPCRHIKWELKDYFIKTTTEYEIEEVDIKMCSCEVRPVDSAIKCGHLYCMDCVNGFEECPICFEEKPLNPKRIFQV